jgi:hypothetical protein
LSEAPVLIMLADSLTHQLALEEAGYRVVRISAAQSRPVLRVLRPRRPGPAIRPRALAERGRANRSLLLPMSRAARMLRASVNVLMKWQDRGWLTRRPTTMQGHRLVDLREALLVVWLHNGPDCVSAELATLVGGSRGSMSATDSCQAKVPAWKRRLGGLGAGAFEAAVGAVHDHGYACHEVEDCVRRLSAAPTA